MSLIVRIALIAGGAIAGLFVARDAPNFELIQGVMGVVVIAAVIAVLALSRRK